MVTSSTQLSRFSNAAGAATEVDIFEGDTFQQRVPVNADGTWSATLSALSVMRHVLTARIAEIISEPRIFSVEEAIPPLVLDTSPVTLQTMLYVITSGSVSTLPTYPSGSTVTRTASGGRPSYTYVSSNSAVADVSANGLVSPRSNGTATITARDGVGQSKSYSVTVLNVWKAEYIGDFIYRGATGYQKPGGHLPTRAEVAAIGAQFTGRWEATGAPAKLYWTSELAGSSAIGSYYWLRHPTTGQEASNLTNGVFPVFSVFPKNT